MDATRRFVEMVNDESTADLTEGWLLLASHAAPGLDADGVRARLDDLAGACAEPTLHDLRHLLFDELGFTGVTDDYYAPANSLPHHVLDRRRGIPISLAAIMIEIGSRAGVELEGVGMPGHFLVRPRGGAEVFVDPFHGGVELDVDGCRALFHHVAGPKAPFDPDYLAPVTAGAMLCRMAANLVNAYRRVGDRHGLRWAARLRAGCPGVSGQERVQLAQALARAGAFDEAAQQLDEAVGTLGRDEAERSRQQAMRHRARLN